MIALLAVMLTALRNMSNDPERQGITYCNKSCTHHMQLMIKHIILLA